MTQQPLKSFDRPLMNGSLFNSILVTFIFYYRQSDGDKSIASWANLMGTKVLLGREYAD